MRAYLHACVQGQEVELLVSDSPRYERGSEVRVLGEELEPGRRHERLPGIERVPLAEPAPPLGVLAHEPHVRVHGQELARIQVVPEVVGERKALARLVYHFAEQRREGPLLLDQVLADYPALRVALHVEETGAAEEVVVLAELQREIVHARGI